MSVLPPDNTQYWKERGALEAHERYRDRLLDESKAYALAGEMERAKEKLTEYEKVCAMTLDEILEPAR